MKETPGNTEIASPSRRHRYPTRWNLRRHPSLFQEVPRVEDTPKDQLNVACKRRKEERHPFFCLPKEIVYRILALIPAKVLHEVVRFACKQWYRILSDPVFVRLHSRMSSASFLIQDTQKIYYVEANSGRFNATEIQIPFHDVSICGSLNGLVLLHDLTNTEMLHVMNPATKVKITLPPVVRWHRFRFNGSAGFALNSSGHLKVVHVNFTTEVHSMWVFTMGVDQGWRFIDLPGIPMDIKAQVILSQPPCFIAGSLYWFGSEGSAFALDVDTETMYKLSVPEDIVEGRIVKFLSMGTSLGLMTGDGDVSRPCEVWKLTDVKSGEWTEVTGINVRAISNKVDEMFRPKNKKRPRFFTLSLFDGEFWFYYGLGEEMAVVCYNLAKESFMFFPIIDSGSFLNLIYPHVQTFLSPHNYKS